MMKKFFIKTILFLTSTAIVSLLMINLLYNKIDTGNYYKIDDKYQNIIFGHSHTACAFNDTIIKNTLNLSNSGECMFYTYFKVKKIVENNKKKNIFISFTNNYIDNENDTHEIFSEHNMTRWGSKYTALMDAEDTKTLFENNPKALIKTEGLATKKYLFFLMKKQNNMVKDFSWGKVDYVKKCKVDSIIKSQEKLKKEVPSQFKYSVYELQYLDKIVALCKQNNANLYFVRCPVHKKWGTLGNEKHFQELLKTRYKNIPFFDFKDFPVSNKYFADLHHLNYLGQEKFSSFFNDLIVNGLLKKENKQGFINQEMKKINE